MCQSKSDGGARCESHAKKALAEHQIAYSNLVQQECANKGIAIDPAALELTPEEKANVSSQFSADYTVQKTRYEAQKAKQTLVKLQRSFTEALAADDLNRLATLIRKNDPELQSITDDNETRRLKFAEDMANATNEKEKDEIIANNKNEMYLLNKRKEKLNFLSKKEAINITNIYHGTRNSSKALLSLTCLKKANEDALTAKEVSLAKVSLVREQMEKTAIANKLRHNPGFKEAESSQAFQNSPELHKWNVKERELKESYRMTSGYQNQLAAKISAYKKAGMHTTEIELAYRMLTIRKAKLAYQNIAEFYGPASAHAKAAIENYDEVKHKEHSF